MITSYKIENYISKLPVLDEDDTICVFWDIENISFKKGQMMEFISALEDYCFSHGKRMKGYVIYANRKNIHLSSLIRRGFTVLRAETKSERRNNLADTAIKYQIFRTAYENPFIKDFLIITNDRDFKGTVEALNHSGRTTHIIYSCDKVSRPFIRTARYFYKVDEVLKRWEMISLRSLIAIDAERLLETGA